MPLEKPSVSGRYPCKHAVRSKPDRHDVQDQRRTIYCRWDWYRTHAAGFAFWPGLQPITCPPRGSPERRVCLI
jgi:hypothetical protein